MVYLDQFRSGDEDIPLLIARESDMFGSLTYKAIYDSPESSDDDNDDNDDDSNDSDNDEEQYGLIPSSIEGSILVGLEDTAITGSTGVFKMIADKFIHAYEKLMVSPHELQDQLENQLEDMLEDLLVIETQHWEELDRDIARTPSLLPGDIWQGAARLEAHEMAHFYQVEIDYETVRVTAAALQLELKSVQEHDNPKQRTTKNIRKRQYRMTKALLGEQPPRPWYAYVILGACIIGLSSLGPFLKLQQNSRNHNNDEILQYTVNPTLQTLWMQMAAVMILFPLALYFTLSRADYCYSNKSTDTVALNWPSMKISDWSLLVLAGVSYAGWSISLAWSFHFTSVGNAVTLGNSQVLLFWVLSRVILLWQGGRSDDEFYLSATSNLSLEGSVGGLLALSGLLFCSWDSYLRSNKESVSLMETLQGDLYGLFSSFSGAVFVITAKVIRPKMELYTFMFGVMLVAVLTNVQILIIGDLADGSSLAELSWDLHPEYGFFGWMNMEIVRFPMVVGMAVVCQIVGPVGYIYSMHHFGCWTISIAALLEPVIAEMLANMLGVAPFLGWIGWLGNAFVMAGTLAIVYKASSSEPQPPPIMFSNYYR